VSRVTGEASSRPVYGAVGCARGCVEPDTRLGVMVVYRVTAAGPVTGRTRQGLHQSGTRRGGYDVGEGTHRPVRQLQVDTGKRDSTWCLQALLGQSAVRMRRPLPGAATCRAEKPVASMWCM